MSSNSSAVAAAADALLVRDVDGQYRPARAEEVLSQARRVLSQRVRRGATMSSPQAVKDYLRLEIGVLEHEVFCVLFVDAQHRIIELKQMFRGTVTQTSVYPREVVKAALGCNAAAVLLAHNHPSGAAEPSRADEFLTQTLRRRWRWWTCGSSITWWWRVRRCVRSPSWACSEQRGAPRVPLHSSRAGRLAMSLAIAGPTSA